MFDWDLDWAWTEKDSFLCVAKDNTSLQKQKNKLNGQHSSSIALNHLRSASYAPGLCIEALRG
jgi:hypothetical protein